MASKISKKQIGPLSQNMFDVEISVLGIAFKKVTVQTLLLFTSSVFKPSGAALRCLDCNLESSCPYSAKKVYLDAVKSVKLIEFN